MEIGRCQLREGNPVSDLGCKPGTSEEEKWKRRMFVNFRDLNKAFPHGFIPSTKDRPTSRRHLWPRPIKFHDAYLRYNHIKMAKGNAFHTTFYAENDIYHYTIMSFGLINVGATYHRMLNKLLLGSTSLWKHILMKCWSSQSRASIILRI